MQKTMEEAKTLKKPRYLCVGNFYPICIITELTFWHDVKRKYLR